MPRIIASTYEILEQIGAGGAGIVYLARHLRLDKLVVLKADKRTLSTKPEVLRREVNAMKNLSHTYIPQVYDFLEEDNVVYTVMDYIEGESLDKPLKRGQRFTQAQIVEWACQLLEALCYLHSRPPHGILHGDIKPANIMLTPQGDIRIIDFNIALALGEEGAVQVGFSQGYASPEHYGLDYAVASQTLEDCDLLTQVTAEDPKTVVSTEERSEYRFGDSSTGGKRTVMLDVRSDIYSLGATLYHLLSGIRPSQNAKEVRPLSARDDVSPAVADIIQKAMAPNPDQRYQSAEEMLCAFEHLHENDSRTKHHKRHTAAVAAVLTAVFLAGGICSLVGLKQMEQSQAAARIAAEAAEEAERAAKEAEQAAKEAEQAAKEALEWINDSQNALQAGDVSAAVQYAMNAVSLETPYTPQAQKALTDALGIYDLSDGYKSYMALTLPSEPLKVTLSPSGTRVAALTSGQVTVFDTETGEQLAQLAADPSALSDIVFSGDDVLIYAGEGALRAYDLLQGTELWAGKPATGISLSADGTTVAAVYRDETSAAVYDTANGNILKTVDFMGKHQRVVANDVFADPEDNLFALSGDGHWLAVSFSDGALWVFDLQDSENDVEIYEPSEYTHFEGGFCGAQFAFVSTGDAESVFAVIDMDKLEQLGAFQGTVPFHTYADENGIYVATEDILVKLDPETGDQTEVAYTETDITAFAIGDPYTIAVTQDGSYSFFDRAARLLEKHEDTERCDFAVSAGQYAVTASLDVPSLRVLVLENHADQQVFTYDMSLPHDEARMSADGKTVMLFRYDVFYLYSISGELLAQVDIPDAEQVYDQQYRRDSSGSYLEVTYNDGLIRCYSAADGSVLSETEGEQPDGTLYEEFETDHFKITSPLHGTPAVYDKQSGELLRELEPDAYLTYVTQVGEYLITEYISAQGDRYGLLLDQNCETLAELPNLCDILPDGTLVFDDMRGNLRKTRIYSIQELMTLAEN